VDLVEDPMIWLASLALAVEPGDVVFQRSRSDQAAAIEIATGSRWSHVGLVLEQDGALVVLEAVGPVRILPYAQWVARGVDGEVGVARPRVPVDAAALATAGRKFLGRPYDPMFSWDDERLYCSELVVKVYAAVGVELGELAPVSSFHLDDPLVARKLAERGLPLDRKVVSPESLWVDVDLAVVDPSER
jgi:hypothetical protein